MGVHASPAFPPIPSRGRDTALPSRAWSGVLSPAHLVPVSCRALSLTASVRSLGKATGSSHSHLGPQLPTTLEWHSLARAQRGGSNHPNPAGPSPSAQLH